MAIFGVAGLIEVTHFYATWERQNKNKTLGETCPFFDLGASVGVAPQA